MDSREFACGSRDGVRHEPRPAARFRRRGVGRDAPTAGASGSDRVRPRGRLSAARDGGVARRQRAHLSPSRGARRDPALCHTRLLQSAAHRRGTQSYLLIHSAVRKRISCTRIEIPPLFFAVDLRDRDLQTCSCWGYVADKGEE